MTFYGLIFYILAALILAATALAVTRRNPVHAVVYLVVSFLGTALLFYLLGSPFLAALEVIIYAGAIMVLFLFVMLMMGVRAMTEQGFNLRQWFPAVLLSLAFLAVTLLVVLGDPQGRVPLEAAMATPKAFGLFVFERYWLAVEIMSLLLLVGLLAAILVGKGRGMGEEGEERP